MLLTSYVGKCNKKRHLMKSRGEGQTFGGTVRAITGRNESQHQIKRRRMRQRSKYIRRESPGRSKKVDVTGCVRIRCG